jgi:PAS domain S-box-containing protein
LLERVAQDVSLALDRIEGLVGRRQAEEALRASEEKYRLLVENAGEAVLVVQEGQLIFANSRSAQMVGVPVSEMVGRPFSDFVHPSDRALVLERYRHRQEGVAVPAQYSFRVVTPTGRVLWGDLNVVPILWGGKPATLNFVSDATERKRAEEDRQILQDRLAQAHKMESVGRLAGGVAHDFNNMLGVILGHAELGLQQVDPGQSLATSLRGIRDAAQRSAGLTKQLLAFARQQAVVPRLLDLNRTVEEMLEMLRRLIGEEIVLVWRPGHDLRAVLMDPVQLQQVLANLCLNARDAIGGVGRVTIETWGVTVEAGGRGGGTAGVGAGEYAVLAVSDTGSGMAADVLEHLFEPYFTTKQVGKGTGLGLATVYGIVQQHNGHVDVSSEVGRGSTFRVFLRGQPGAVAVAVEEEPAGSAKGGRETVLVVEDEPSVLTLGQRVLEGLGYRVLAAATPHAAVELAEQHRGEIDLLVTDVVMPEMNGRDLAQRVAEICPGVRCLYMSGYTADVIAPRGVLEAGVHFIQKPFSLVELAAKVRGALNGASGAMAGSGSS